MTDDAGDWQYQYAPEAGKRHDDNDGLREAAIPNADLWNSRIELKSIYDNSRRLMIAPWTMLGLAICRSLVSIPYWVNYGCVFIGDSGGGKSRLPRALDKALPFLGLYVPDFNQIEVGSGEAIADVYAHPAEKDDPANGIRRGDLVWHNKSHARLFGFDEVGRMFKIGNRDGGSTIFEFVKQGITGSPLGRHLARGAGTMLNPGQYRFAFITNAQPSRSGVLLNDDEVEGGFPGRLLWFETRDPRAVIERDDSPVVPYGIKDIDWRNVGNVVALPQMDAAHRADAELYHTDQRSPIDGHRTMLRAKVAVGLMRLNGRIHLNDEDWDLAGIVVEESVRVRVWVQQVLAQKNVEAEKARGQSAARQQAAAAEALSTLRLTRICNNLRRYADDGIPQNEWRRRLKSEDRPYYEDALAELSKGKK